MALVLAVDMAGVPSRWLMVEEAISYYARCMVAWSLGDPVATYRGGICRLTGRRSELSTHSIIAIKGAVDFIKDHHTEPHLSNTSLFFRDRHMCAYCGGQYKERDLSRDHVIPVYLNGRDRWMNVVTACRSCNIRKGGRTPEEANMPLLCRQRTASFRRPSRARALRCRALSQPGPGLASDRVSEDQVSIATTQWPPPPRDCRHYLHTRT